MSRKKEEVMIEGDTKSYKMSKGALSDSGIFEKLIGKDDNISRHKKQFLSALVNIKRELCVATDTLEKMEVIFRDIAVLKEKPQTIGKIIQKEETTIQKNEIGNAEPVDTIKQFIPAKFSLMQKTSC